LISGCRRQIIPVINAPHIAIEINGGAKPFPKEGNEEERRSSPYPPNLSKIAAKTIDPATGASTWAFGSHKWERYNGIFTINAKIVINHQSLVEGKMKGEGDAQVVNNVLI